MRLPPKSITDHETSHRFAKDRRPLAPIEPRVPAVASLSFDESSLASSASAREDFLLVLVSSVSGSVVQTKNQNRALTMVEACGIQPEVLDASDPANALVRDELFEMSGIRGVFPQFFLVQGDRTSFFADFAELEHMNDEGTLAEWLGMELPTVGPAGVANGDAAASEDADAEDSNADQPARSAPADPDGSISKEFSMRDTGVAGNEMDCEHRYAASSSTEDLFNVDSVSKVLNAMSPAPVTPRERTDSSQKDRDDESESEFENESNFESYDDDDDDDIDNNNNNNNNMMILSIPTESIDQEEWSDPMLLEKYQDEILALEDYLQEQEEKEEEQEQELLNESRGKAGEPAETRRGAVDYDGRHSGAYVPSGEHRTGPNERTNRVGEHNRKISSEDGGERFVSPSFLPVAATITPTSSSSPPRSTARGRRSDKVDPNDNHPVHTNNFVRTHSEASDPKNNEKDIPCNVSMETTSTRTETEQLLRAEIEDLKVRCEKLKAERYMVEGQLKEARQKNHEIELRALDHRKQGTVHKYQLQQTLRCGYCTRVFRSNPSSPNAPIASQACGHSVCRNCCQARLAPARRNEQRRRDGHSMTGSELLRSTMASDLFMCVDMDHVYSEAEQEQRREGESCPICSAPRAFKDGRLHVNESLCAVLRLLDPA
ncbi:unnamed protein product [Pseudo-nitzschia multistriata]|uniref:Uncharacterized protein n=1 Tax=Pseudo-nitzschia multistriata TaxID=183589 RepID=A0A448YYG5_9STRA|nr:unnamed protein product [Pseudo-nitzschia multistriata]